MKQGFIFLAFLIVLSSPPLLAQTGIMTYQGRVQSGGSDFTGTGDFKFALVSSDPDAGVTTHWSNDGTSVAGGEPVDAVSAPVSNGLFAIGLGDTGHPNMIALDSAVFAQSELELKIWFNDGTHGFSALDPPQPLTAAPYAFQSARADSVADGAVGSMQLAQGAAAANLAAEGQAGVASGGLVMSETENAALVNAGYVEIGSTMLIGRWRRSVSGTPPSPRRRHTAVWTGSEMIVWGGTDGSALGDGGRYDPVADNWTAMTTNGAPSARYLHTAVWTGGKMIVWGGTDDISDFNDGGRYDPASDSWMGVAIAGAPSAREQHTAVWTGTEMIAWGGFSGGNLNDGGRYDPVANSWAAVTTLGAPAARSDHSAVWTGGGMIVWGGFSGGIYVNTGGRYNPGAGSWSAVTTGDAPAGRVSHAAVWTGNEMIVWGGFVSGAVNDGGRYDPAADGWTQVATNGAPAARVNHTAVWTGSEMIVWGGDDNSGSDYRDGGRYDPATDVWTTVTTSGAPAARERHTAVWTDAGMIVWGGYDGSYFNDTWLYSPGKAVFLYQKL
jgi:hypothetical protein